MVILGILSLSVCSIMIFPLMGQPLSLGLSLISSTFFFCLVAGGFISSWYGYVLFLIYVGGLLVIFAYVSVLSPNMLFGDWSMGGVIFIGGGFFLWFFYSSFFVDLSGLDDWVFWVDLKVCGGGLVSSGMVSVFISLVIILLLSLLVVVKVCCIGRSSLRFFDFKSYA